MKTTTNTAKREAAKAKANEHLSAVQAQLTEAIIAGIESDPGNWTKPWVDHLNAFGMARNAVTGKSYNGGNVLWLTLVAMTAGYSSGEWATYKQWASIGAQVRKGEKSTIGVDWKRWVRVENEGQPNETKRTGITPFVFRVFNADQVDGYTPAEPEARPTVDPIENAEAFFAAQGATETNGIGGAYYSPGSDRINVPHRDDFTDAAAYYCTRAHEFTHWTGHRSRLARPGIVDFDGFGSEQYAREELVAELGAVFVSAHLGITPEPREDHAQYLAHWLKAAKGDASYVWKAATAAARACEWMVARAEALTIAA